MNCTHVTGKLEQHKIQVRVVVQCEDCKWTPFCAWHANRRVDNKQKEVNLVEHNVCKMQNMPCKIQMPGDNREMYCTCVYITLLSFKGRSQTLFLKGCTKLEPVT